MNKTEDMIRDTDPGRLAELLEKGPEEERLWQPEELSAILRHQLSAPVRFELGGLKRGPAERVRAVAEAQGLLLKSFEDLLCHSCPPVELLRMAKEFAKRYLVSPKKTVLPREVANVIYYASIAAARLRCQRRISSLSDEELQEGLTWCLRQPWLASRVRDLLQECATDVGNKQTKRE